MLKMTISNCPFCRNNRKIFLSKNLYDVEEMYFYEDDRFSISPDLSPLVPGHLLIIPTCHYASFGELTDVNLRKEMENMAQMLLGTTDLLFFEHGAVLKGEGGASIDHAHLHVMPRPKDLTIQKIDQYIKASGCVPSDKVPAYGNILNKLYTSSQPYIYYKLLQEEWVYPVNTIPHQFLRRMLQSYSNQSYNWRETFSTELCRNNVRDTIQFVKVKNNTL